MQPTEWAEKMKKEVLSYHVDKNDAVRALEFIIQGKREDAEREREAAEMQRLKASHDAQANGIGLARVREQHADYLEKQAAALEAMADALERQVKGRKKPSAKK